MSQLLLISTSLSASVGAILNEALFRLERRLASWTVDSDAFNAHLQNAFGVQPSTSAESADLKATIGGSGLEISVQILDASTIDGLNAAYTSSAPDAGERIYLNASWLELATAERSSRAARGTRSCHRLAPNAPATAPVMKGQFFGDVANERPDPGLPRKRQAHPHD